MRRIKPHPLTLPLAIPWVHKPMQMTEKRTKDTSGPRHLLTLASVDLWPSVWLLSALEEDLLILIAITVREIKNIMYHTWSIYAFTAQTDNCTEPLSDSINDQVPGTTDGPGDQELHVIGAPNVSQNSAEGKLYT